MSEPSVAQQNSIHHIIAVMSGKGGVGKSLVTALLALGLQRQGARVGILDADLACPSIAAFFGATPQATTSEGSEVEPLLSRDGVKITSMRAFMASDAEPLTWRGPMVSSAMKQFYSEIHWGDLDYLLVDAPPGTADVPLTILQALPLDGVVIVSTPQLLARKVVQKCVNLVLQNNQHIVGVVENMATFTAADGVTYPLYGPDAGSTLASMAGAPLLAHIPLDTFLATLCDSGHIEDYSDSICATLVTHLLKSLGKNQGAIPAQKGPLS